MIKHLKCKHYFDFLEFFMKSIHNRKHTHFFNHYYHAQMLTSFSQWWPSVIIELLSVVSVVNDAPDFCASLFSSSTWTNVFWLSAHVTSSFVSGLQIWSMNGFNDCCTHSWEFWLIHNLKPATVMDNWSLLYKLDTFGGKKGFGKSTVGKEMCVFSIVDWLHEEL